MRRRGRLPLRNNWAPGTTENEELSTFCFLLFHLDPKCKRNPKKLQDVCTDV